MILASEDDPFVPFSSIAAAVHGCNDLIELVATPHGGHCAFISDSPEERFWCEGQIVEFCKKVIGTE
jgi:predicted alpha/beta-fold hydrolase